MAADSSLAGDSVEVPRNVLGGALAVCSWKPLTGFYRDGCCNTGAADRGRHVVCAEATEAFLAFERMCGNDLVTPRPQFGFPGLAPGDRWCVCAARWLEAFEHWMAPPVILEATHEAALDLIPLRELRRYAR